MEDTDDRQWQSHNDTESPECRASSQHDKAPSVGAPRKASRERETPVGVGRTRSELHEGGRRAGPMYWRQDRVGTKLPLKNSSVWSVVFEAEAVRGKAGKAGWGQVTQKLADSGNEFEQEIGGDREIWKKFNLVSDTVSHT